MIDNKILANAAMSDEELDQVAGGSTTEIFDDCIRFREIGINDEKIIGTHYDCGYVHYGWLRRKSRGQTCGKC